LLLIIVDVIFTNLRDVGPLFGLENLRAEVLPPAVDPIPGLGVTMSYYYLLLAAAVGIVIFSIWLERSRFGYGMEAINEDEEVAEGLGIPAFRLKVLSIILSGFAAGIVGSLYGAYTGYIDPGAFFGLTLTFEIVFIGAIGSLGEWYGPVLGVLLFIPADQFLASAFTPELGRIVFGGLFIVIMLTLPKGLGRYFADELHEDGTIPGERGGGGGTPEEVAAND
jgi:ABC-type branched-subunit amino acid transport system permease subunit